MLTIFFLEKDVTLARRLCGPGVSAGFDPATFQVDYCSVLIKQVPFRSMLSLQLFRDSEDKVVMINRLKERKGKESV